MVTLPDGVDTSALARALYARDASVYRVAPLGVARPESVEELRDVVTAARERGLPVTVRGAGTSCAGNAVGPGLVVDLRALDRLSIDAEARSATVQPGVVLADLNAAAAAYGLRFGPDPSTSSRCTIGGMIGNNACGPRALGYGRTADNVLAVQCLDPLPVEALREIGVAHEALIRHEFARFSRQVSGYSLEHLLPERFSPAAFLAGSEGTLGIVTEATVRLVPEPSRTVMVALGYPTMAEAADAVGAVLPFEPTACEGLDDRIVDVARRRGSVGDLPRGRGYLVVELAGDDDAELRHRAAQLVAASSALDSRVLQGDPAAHLWRVRADGAGLAAVALEQPAHAGWEDAAVPPDRLGTYLRDFEALLTSHGLHALPYGHFGEGCIHARIDLPLEAPGRFRAFLLDAAALVASHGGSLSGEHGDGRARSELLPLMYSAEAIDVFCQVKTACDPVGLLNPGIVVDAAPVDASLVEAAHVDHPLANADRCTGVGACLSHQPGGHMCPSHRATSREQDSTRGRARVLQEVMSGGLVASVTDPAVADALEHCLACKACRSECPTGVDVAALKSVVLEQRYRGRLRPRGHLTLGRLPQWLGLLQRLPAGVAVINAVGRTPLRRVLALAVGMDRRRSFPRLSRWQRPVEGGPGQPVAVWVDSFTRSLSPHAAEAAFAVLRAAGLSPTMVDESACCGLTWITTGQRDEARRRLRHALDVLAPLAEQGVLIVGLEPSCTAVWRSDAPDLLPDDTRVTVVAAQVRTLAETLTGVGFTPPDLSGHTIVAQPHCHHRSVMGWAADAALLRLTGAELVVVDGCCGLAGNYGVEDGHYEVSVAVAEDHLLPALREHPDAIFLADGFSCRTQAADLLNRQGMTLAEVLATHL